MNNDAFERIFEDLERVFNKQLPVARRKLSELLKMQHPHVICKDGSTHSFRFKELETLASLIPQEDWDKLELPILVVSNAKYGEGAATISGKYEVQLVSKLLNIGIEKAEQTLVIYSIQLSELRKKIRTVTQIVQTF